jgi:hypothetical protein
MNNEEVVIYLLQRFAYLSNFEKAEVIKILNPEFILLINKIVPNIPFITNIAISIHKGEYVAPTIESYLEWEQKYINGLIEAEQIRLKVF